MTEKPRPLAVAHPVSGPPDKATASELTVEIEGVEAPIVLAANMANTPNGATPPSFIGLGGLPGAGGLPDTPPPALRTPGHHPRPAVVGGGVPIPVNTTPAVRSQPPAGAPAASPNTGAPSAPPNTPPIASVPPGTHPGSTLPASALGSPPEGNPSTPPAGHSPSTPGPIAGLPSGPSALPTNSTQPTNPAQPTNDGPLTEPSGTGTPPPVGAVPPEMTGLPIADLLPGTSPSPGVPGAPQFQPVPAPQAQNATHSVPEPGSLMLLAAGGWMLWWMRRPRSRLAAVRR